MLYAIGIALVSSFFVVVFLVELLPPNVVVLCTKEIPSNLMTLMCIDYVLPLLQGDIT